MIITPRFPFPIEKGDKLRIYHQIRHLSKDHEIYLASVSDVKIKPEHLEHISTFVKEVRVFRIRKWNIAGSLLFRFVSGLPLQVLYFYQTGIRSKIHDWYYQIRPDIIYNQLIRTAEYSRDLPGYKVIDYMDAFSEGMKMRMESSSPWLRWFFRMEYRRLLRYEKAVFKDFDGHTVISLQDGERMSLGKDTSLSVIPNGVDTDFFQSSGCAKKYDICFVGNMGYRPNVLAAEFLCHEIVPELVRIRPGLKVLLAGARPDPRVRQLAGKHVDVSGWMEDIRQAYDESLIFVAPIFTGIGQQNKVLEAMSMQVPCICTQVINNAIGGKPGEDVLLADDKDGFIHQIQKVWADPSRAKILAEKGRQLVVSRYGWENQVQKLKSIFDARYDRGKQ